MADPLFATTGNPPRIQRIEALAFHDATGRIRHMHHSIVLEGAEPRPYESMLEEVKAQALALGTDVSKLKVLHVKTPFNLAAQHKVDVKKRVLVELRAPQSVLPVVSLRPRSTRKQRTR